MKEIYVQRCTKNVPKTSTIFLQNKRQKAATINLTTWQTVTYKEAKAHVNLPKKNNTLVLSWWYLSRSYFAWIKNLVIKKCLSLEQDSIGTTGNYVVNTLHFFFCFC